MTHHLPDERDLLGETIGPPRRERDPWVLVLGIMGGVLLGTGVTFAILGFVGVFEEPTPPTIPPPPTVTAPAPTSPPPTFGEEPTAASVVAAVIPSTVAVEVDSFLLAGSGSGVVYGLDGYIITSAWNFEGNPSVVTVTTADGRTHAAKMLGVDRAAGLALVKIDAQDLAPISLGSLDDLSIGERAVAIGNPLGLAGGPTVTAGIVSAFDRSLTGSPNLYGLVQTDAPIAPGSSGGALVDAAGRLIGITTAIAVSDVGPEGLGFAVPVDIAVGVANDLIANGEVRHALLGINGQTFTTQEGPAQYPVGVRVSEISSGSAYAEAGGRINDVIVAIDGHDVRTIDGLLSRLRRLRAGETVPVRILRSDADTTLNVTLGLLE